MKFLSICSYFIVYVIMIDIIKCMSIAFRRTWNPVRKLSHLVVNRCVISEVYFSHLYIQTTLYWNIFSFEKTWPWTTCIFIYSDVGEIELITRLTTMINVVTYKGHGHHINGNINIVVLCIPGNKLCFWLFL